LSVAKPKVLISDKLSAAAVEIFKNRGVDVDIKTGLKPEELLAIIKDYDGLAIRSATKATAKILEKAKNLKVIGRAGIGVDNVYIPAATAAGEGKPLAIHGVADNLPDGDLSAMRRRQLRLGERIEIVPARLVPVTIARPRRHGCRPPELQWHRLGRSRRCRHRQRHGNEEEAEVHLLSRFPQIGDHVRELIGSLQARIDHPGVGHLALGVLQVVGERSIIPDDARLLHRIR